MNKEANRDIIKQLLCLTRPSIKELNKVKKRTAKKFRLNQVPSNSEIILCLKPEERIKLIKVLRRKLVRSASGVIVIAVMTKPWSCPQKETCAYCPGGPERGSPQSYTGLEPAAMRGVQNDFDPYRQVDQRIIQLKAIGHTVDKIELIVMGGTFPSMPIQYQKSFIQRCLDAITKKKSKSLIEAMKNAEKSRISNVGITVETRPDWAKENNVNQMLKMGITRVEIGVQNVYDDIYEKVNRGHTVDDVIKATRLLKDAGLKVVYHMMPGLPNSNFERDLEGFKTIFSNPNFKPDMLKIYPCLVIEGTKIFDWWKQGLYEPYKTDEAIKLVMKVKKMIPKWIRIMRIQRDIPAYLIKAGVTHSNLRELVQKKLKTQKVLCKCIRCRESGLRWLKNKVKPNFENIQTQITKYQASQGKEFFISVDDPINKVLLGYLRLRFPSDDARRPEIQGKNVSIIRELRVVGPLVPVGRYIKEAHQHKGLGEMLLKKAEEISKEQDKKKILITSALGTKKYYKKFGFRHDGPYMSKKIV
jgi:elongator complex protein 3